MKKQLVGEYKSYKVAQFAAKSLFKPEHYPITVYRIIDGEEVPHRIIYEDGTEKLL